MSQRYAPLEEDKSDHEESQSGEDYEALLSQNASRKKVLRRNLIILVVLVPIACLLLIALGAWIGVRWLVTADDICPRHVQRYCKHIFS
jgi:hypothetical protein